MHVVTVHDPFHPMRGREVREMRKKRCLHALAPKTAKPFVVFVDGKPVLRKDWDMVVGGDQIVTIMMLPQGGGGGGSNPMRTLLMIAVIVVATWFGGPAGFGASLGWGSTAVAVGQAAILVGGSMLVNAMVPIKPPDTGIGANVPAASPTYNLQAQGNSARLGAAIPVQYGRLRVYPDFAAQPYVEYASNEQYLYQLLCIGQGEYSVEAVKIGDNAISSYDNVTYEIVPPGSQTTLFPANVTQSSDVSGQELLTNNAVGPFIANNTSTKCAYIGIDLVCPRGLYYANDNGSLGSKSVTVKIEAQEVNQLGVATGSWVTIGTETVSGATTTPIRKSFKYAAPSSVATYPRFQVRCTRTDTKDTSTRAGHEVDWAGLRAYMPDTTNYGNITLLAVKAQASNNLSQQAARQINVIATRKIKTVTATGLSSTTSATRSLAAALADAAMNTTYGGGMSSANIDWAALYALDQTLTARGDYLDVRFDTASTLWEALTQMGQVARTKPYMQGGILHIARDQSASVPVALFSMRNIVKNSMSVQYLTPSSTTADSVEVTYFDNTVWQQTTVTCTLTGGTSNNPAKVSMLGISSRDQAFREGLYQAAANQYRRKVIKFSTECEGFIPSFGDLIAIQHDMPAWGQVAEVTGWVSGTKTLTVNEQLTWTAGLVHYIGLRKRDGSIDGPYQVTQGASANVLVLASSPAITPYTGYDEERTHIAFGPADTWRQPARVVSVVPRGPYNVEITAVNEDPSVHTADQGQTAPALSYSQLPTALALPTINNLTLAIDVTGATPQYVASWDAAPGADHYAIEISWDSGATWSPLATEYATQHRWAANRNSSAYVRVAGVNLARGAWATASVDYSSVPSTPTGFNVAVAGVNLQLTWLANPELDVVAYELRAADSGWGTGGEIFKGSAHAAITTAPAANTSAIYYLRAIDFLGNYGGTATVTFTASAVPSIVDIVPSFYDTSATSATVTLTWTDVAPQFGLGGYQISYGSTTMNVSANRVTLPADWVGNRTFTVKTVDKNGNISSGYSEAVNKLLPNTPTNFRAQVIDNTVMLYWAAPTVTTLPISHYVLRRGSSWASADVDYGRKDGLFTTINETQGGTYTYWIATVDTDDNLSTPVSVTAVVAQPPDFQLFGQFTSSFTGTKSSALLEAGAVILPVNTTETWAQHFTSHSWSTPQDQINAGYPLFIQPSNSPGYYEETFDFGTVLAASRVTAAYTSTALAGSPSVAVTISTSVDNSTWLDNTGSTQIFATNFRYVKVRITVTDVGTTAILQLSALSVTLDAKLKNDAGSTSCASTDASGTVANFNTSFVDVQSITVTPQGTTPVVAVYDFKDTVITGTYSVSSNVCTVTATAHGLVVGQNVKLTFTSGTAPTGTYTVASVVNANSYTVALTTANTSGNVSTYPEGMRVYLFNNSGTRVSGTASWSIKGY